jgi:hypothetical protein
MERWTFDMIAGDDGKEKQVRVVLRAGEDPGRHPRAQIGMDGIEVPVDDAEVDYEAPEWKAVQLFTAGGGSQQLWDGLKDRLRAEV